MLDAWIQVDLGEHEDVDEIVELRNLKQFGIQDATTYQVTQLLSNMALPCSLCLVLSVYQSPELSDGTFSVFPSDTSRFSVAEEITSLDLDLTINSADQAHNFAKGSGPSGYFLIDIDIDKFPKGIPQQTSLDSAFDYLDF